MVAFFNEWHFSCHDELLHSILQRQPCGLFKGANPLRCLCYELTSPCGLCETWFCCQSGIWPFTLITGAVFAFVKIIGFEPIYFCVENRCLNRSAISQPTWTCCPSCLIWLLSYQIQHTQCVPPCGILHHDSGVCVRSPSHLVIARRAWLQHLALIGLLVLHTLWMDSHARWKLRVSLSPHRWPGDHPFGPYSIFQFTTVLTMDPFGQKRACMVGPLAWCWCVGHSALGWLPILSLIGAIPPWIKFSNNLAAPVTVAALFS